MLLLLSCCCCCCFFFCFFFVGGGGAVYRKYPVCPSLQMFVQLSFKRNSSSPYKPILMKHYTVAVKECAWRKIILVWNQGIIISSVGRGMSICDSTQSTSLISFNWYTCVSHDKSVTDKKETQAYCQFRFQATTFKQR